VKRSCLPRSLQDYRSSIVQLKGVLEETMRMFSEVRDVAQQSMVQEEAGEKDMGTGPGIDGGDAMLLMDVYRSLFSHIHRKIYSVPEGRESIQEVTRSHQVVMPTEPEMHTVLEEYSSKLLSMFQQKLSQSVQMTAVSQPHQGEDSPPEG
jgi:hypothetical protein